MWRMADPAERTRLTLVSIPFSLITLAQTRPQPPHRRRQLLPPPQGHLVLLHPPHPRLRLLQPRPRQHRFVLRHLHRRRQRRRPPQPPLPPPPQLPLLLQPPFHPPLLLPQPQLLGLIIVDRELRRCRLTRSK